MLTMAVDLNNFSLIYWFILCIMVIFCSVISENQFRWQHDVKALILSVFIQLSYYSGFLDCFVDEPSATDA